MNTREYLKHVRKKAAIVAAPGFVLFIASILLEKKLDIMPIIGLAAIAVGVAIWICMSRCKRCNHSLGTDASAYKYCPFCGFSMDENQN